MIFKAPLPRTITDHRTGRAPGYPSWVRALGLKVCFVSIASALFQPKFLLPLTRLLYSQQANTQKQGFRKYIAEDQCVSEHPYKSITLVFRIHLACYKHESERQILHPIFSKISCASSDSRLSCHVNNCFA